jgi:hypothetical protein
MALSDATAGRRNDVAAVVMFLVNDAALYVIGIDGDDLA